MQAKIELLRKVRLYLVTDRRLSQGRSEIEVVQKALCGGVDMVQYREKQLPDREFQEVSLGLLGVTRKGGVPLIIDDRVEIAAQIDADGVHLGQEDLDCREARAILGKDKIIGVSVRNPGQALKAINGGADYLGVGPIYQTQTKQIDHPGGTRLIEEVSRVSPIPIFGIGGINLSNVSEVISAGASGVAVISAIVSSEDITSTCREFVAEIERARPEKLQDRK